MISFVARHSRSLHLRHDGRRLCRDRVAVRRDCPRLSRRDSQRSRAGHGRSHQPVPTDDHRAHRAREGHRRAQISIAPAVLIHPTRRGYGRLLSREPRAISRLRFFALLSHPRRPHHHRRGVCLSRNRASESRRDQIRLNADSVRRMSPFDGCAPSSPQDDRLGKREHLKY